jgi:hypothetical protein
MTARTESEDSVAIICPNLTCRRTLSAPAAARGKIMRCIYCNVPFRVPENATPESDAAAIHAKDKKR